MYLKKLEVFGFKSFLNKTKLPFEPGVTAIVGPNGCGKSNIVDAIKWVLGEQSVKSMRSSSMQDVIFNGTEKHDPLNVAEVSLTLSNESRMLPVDFDEVTVTRRLYRSGESEYLLNKSPVRLLDIRNLLLGTGIGTSSYSIVEQGRMDMIISSRPEDRRYIFEEASGITKYKGKKRQAMLKLEKTRDNLTRINDIINEIERQIRSIERKARKAERYKVRFEELKDLEVRAARKEYLELNSGDSSLRERNRGLKENIGVLERDIKARGEELESIKNEHDSVFNELQCLQNDLVSCTSDIEKKTYVIGVNRERISEIEKAVQRAEWEIEEATERKRRINEHLDRIEVRFLEVRTSREKKEEELGSVNARVEGSTKDLTEYQHHIDMNREKTLNMANEQTRLGNNLIKIEADMQNSFSRKKRLELEKEALEKDIGRVSSELEEITRKAETVKEELEGSRVSFEDFSREFNERRQKGSELEKRSREEEKRLNEIRPRRLLLERLVNEREGVNASVKGIMRQVENGNADFEGVHGILSELVNVDDRFEESMEALLGEFAHSVVVEDAETALRVTEFLNSHSMESVNMLLLSEVPVKEITESSSHQGVLTGENKYRDLLKAFLRHLRAEISQTDAGSVMNNPSAINIREKGEIFSEFFRRTVNFSGKEKIPVFGRQEKVDKLLEEENVISAEIEKIAGEAERIGKWLEDSVSKKEELESSYRHKQMEHSDVTSRKALVKERIESLEDDRGVLDKEIAEEAGTIGRLGEEKSRFEEESNALKEKNRELQSRMEEAHRLLKEISSKREEYLIALADIKAELSGLIKDEQNLLEEVQRHKDSSSRLESDVERKRKDIKESGERIEELSGQILEYEKEIERQKTNAEEKKEHLKEKQERREHLSSEMEKTRALYRAKEEEMSKLRDSARDVDIMKKEIEYKTASLRERILQSYKVDITLADVPEPAENTDREETAEKIRILKEQLEKMGDVSLDAVEEHKHLKERFEFLVKQRDDLEESREALIQAIRRINRTTRKMFMESFENIRKEFNTYFKMLFNGGKGDIILQDENNILECGIDIVVRPPGKKLHNIMQLSGGEKAMTAIALIFAIFKVNPSPFCVLDEIDAPLDESNIVRFCEVLKDFLKLSQFLIVTHNRMTIQLADVLYGITMAEKGVSKVVSVKFAEDKEAAAEDAEPVSLEN
jgi:chromosome segregation protein